MDCLLQNLKVAKLLLGKENTSLLTQDIGWYLIEPKDGSGFDLKYCWCESTSEKCNCCCRALGINLDFKPKLPVCNAQITLHNLEDDPKSHGVYSLRVGFQFKVNQYKLITTSMRCPLDPVSRWPKYDVVIIEAEIYTLGTDTWKSVGSAPFSAFALDFPTYLNGVLHWLFVDKYSRSWIISFDLDNEQFDYHSAPTPSQFTIGVLGGSLYVCGPDRYNGFIDIWVLRKNGDWNSWSKLFSILNVDGISFSGTFIRPISYSSNGTLLMIIHPYGRFLYYHKGRMELKYFTVRDLYMFQAIAYAPSFISPKDILMRGNTNSSHMKSIVAIVSSGEILLPLNQVKSLSMEYTRGSRRQTIDHSRG
ncbi:F-box associated domain [Parasponia andersonii]|uniref:F-box associated domain n=1 Tax=Parasponia andersonii TaxID=3476 RepID=A0A2P5AP04_PARAD|nr:F-box associated domain [Parasponia andersonii]